MAARRTHKFMIALHIRSACCNTIDSNTNDLVQLRALPPTPLEFMICCQSANVATFSTESVLPDSEKGSNFYG